jgi:hypothetical protein
MRQLSRIGLIVMSPRGRLCISLTLLLHFEVSSHQCVVTVSIAPPPPPPLLPL